MSTQHIYMAVSNKTATARHKQSDEARLLYEQKKKEKETARELVKRKKEKNGKEV